MRERAALEISRKGTSLTISMELAQAVSNDYEPFDALASAFPKSSEAAPP